MLKAVSCGFEQMVDCCESYDWRRFICVENGTLKKEDAYILKPGECHTLTRVIRLTSTYDNAKPIALQPQIDAAAKSGGGRVTAEINHLISLITNLDYQWGRYPARERMLTRIDGVKVENVTADSALSIYALHGDPRVPVKNFTIRNVKAKTLRSENLFENVDLDFIR